MENSINDSFDLIKSKIVRLLQLGEILESYTDVFKVESIVIDKRMKYSRRFTETKEDYVGIHIKDSECYKLTFKQGLELWDILENKEKEQVEEERKLKRQEVLEYLKS